MASHKSEDDVSGWYLLLMFPMTVAVAMWVGFLVALAIRTARVVLAL